MESAYWQGQRMKIVGICFEFSDKLTTFAVGFFVKLK